MGRERREPWQAAAMDRILTERGLSTLLTLILTGALLFGGWKMLSTIEESGRLQIAQQERIISRLDEAIDILRRIEVAAARQSGGGRGELVP